METQLAIPRRSEIARAHKARGGYVAAVLPIHYPRALLRAFDVLPMEVWGPPGVDPSRAAAHLQPYVCSIVRNALSFLDSGGADIADLVLVPHTCDSLQGLGTVLIDFINPKQPVLPLYLPRGQGEAAVDYLADEMRGLYRRLEEIFCRSPSDAQLMESIEREEAADQLLSQLHGHRCESSLSDFEFYRLLRSREYLPAETFSDLARSALESAGGDAEQRIPVVLSGIVPEPMEVLRSVSEMGGRVAGDDLASCGRRLYLRGNSPDPFLRMAESLLGGPPDPTRGSPIAERLGHLQGLVTAAGAKGVIFYNIKFCEPELFDHPVLRDGLQQAGIPSIVIEVELSNALPSHALTRIEAFLEMLA